MPDDAAGGPAADPSKDAGDLGSALLPCETNDVEVVSDLDEPNGIQADCEFDDDEPVGLLFTAEAIEPDGQKVTFTGITPEQDRTA